MKFKTTIKIQRKINGRYDYSLYYSNITKKTIISLEFFPQKNQYLIFASNYTSNYTSF